MQLWRRITLEYSVEWPILKEKWKFLLFGLIFQYLHGLAARAVHYLHRPGPVLQDIGFRLLPELGADKAYISETLFSFMFFSFVLWTLHPFILTSKRIYTVLVWYRCLAILVVSQILRIASFMATQLPGPNYHCREGSKMASLPHPKNVSEVLFLNFPYGVVYGCGDLIFSSHMIFTLVFVLTYQKYGSKRWIKQLAWSLAVILSFLIVASRKHYSVDVVVAWYTVNLVAFFVDKQLHDAEVSDRSLNGGSPILPSTTKDKDGQTKEELHKLMNGTNAEISSDWRQRMPANGKVLDDGSPKFGGANLSDIVLNGS
ncbi:hypothetical protein KP509_21G006300 [Ceratopteris richardii]|uniref:Sphingomyelin synthase-like domain-containing protein n=1 Tax=Ceratopteris richardii TaxID=49495 RepID=A0A8T2SAA2_CERRI|nr:hypothetical protein KP509_21G006300 [Ceratopteris richardii]